MKEGPHYRQYGASTSVWFHATNPALTLVYAAGFGVGTSQISKDGGAFANTANLPTYVGNGLYNIVLTAAEMQATYINLTFIAAASANAPVCISIETKLIVSQFFIGADTLPASNIGFEVRGGGGGGEAVKFWPTVANNNGLTIIGAGTGSGIAATGGATGVGLSVSGGATSGYGFVATGGGGNSHGIYAAGNGAGGGVVAVGGTTGIGISGVGGATSGEGLKAYAVAGNSNGGTFIGVGSGTGLAATGGATNGAGIAGAGQGSGVGFQGSSGTSHPTNFFSETIEDITGTVNPGATTLRQGIAALCARFFNLVTQTTTQQIVYASDSITPKAIAAVSDDSVTQVKGRAS